MSEFFNLIQIFGKTICESIAFLYFCFPVINQGCMNSLHPHPPNTTTTPPPLRQINPRMTDINELLILSLACIHDLLSKCKLR